MKSIKMLSMAICLSAFSMIATAQAKTETFNVSGNCGMCKATIEKAAKAAGATYALWDVDKKMLTVKYSSSSTSTAKIQEKIAEVGYDNVGFKGNDAAYDKLHSCCKYERAGAEKMDCCKDGKCSKEGHGEMDCCKDGKCSKEGHDGKDCCKKVDGKMDCCNDGKCTKEGHDGKDCCKKS